MSLYLFNIANYKLYYINLNYKIKLYLFITST